MGRKGGGEREEVDQGGERGLKATKNSLSSLGTRRVAYPFRPSATKVSQIPASELTGRSITQRSRTCGHMMHSGGGMDCTVIQQRCRHYRHAQTGDSTQKNACNAAGMNGV